MAKYLKIAYLIAPDGKVTEQVLNGDGNDCIENTAAIEAAMGEVEDRQLLSESLVVCEPAIAQQSLQLGCQFS